MVYLTVFAATAIPVHVVAADECDEFYRANVGSTVLGVRNTQCTSSARRVQNDTTELN